MKRQRNMPRHKWNTWRTRVQIMENTAISSSIPSQCECRQLAG